MGGPIILVLLSACLMLLSFPPFNYFPLAFIAPLFFLGDVVQAPSLRSAIKKGLLFGLIFMGFFHCWMFTLAHWSSGAAITVLWAAFMLYLCLFYGLFAAVLFFFKDRLWTIPLLWTGMEYLKSIGPLGNPSGTLGYSQTHFLTFLQLASFGGVYFLSFGILTISTLLLNCFLPIPFQVPKKCRNIVIIALLALSIFAVHEYTIPNPKPTLTVSVVQPNHSQEDKLDSNKWPTLRYDFLILNQTILENTNSRVIFWPETITPGLNLNHPLFMNELSTLSQHYKATILFGTPIQRENKYYNSIALVNQNGESPLTYDKRLLMPFGEYWPGRTIFYSIGLKKIIPESDFSPGSNDTLIPISTALDAPKVGCAVCLESLYPWFFRDNTNHGAEFLFTAVNNAWFFNSSVAEKHLQMTTVRAVENHRYVLQSANTGLSAIISPKGELISKLSLNERGILTKKIALSHSKTIYSKIGESWLLFLIALSGLILGLQKLRKN